jgi:hypothetical protein
MVKLTIGVLTRNQTNANANDQFFVKFCQFGYLTTLDLNFPRAVIYSKKNNSKFEYSSLTLQREPMWNVEALGGGKTRIPHKKIFRNSI